MRTLGIIGGIAPESTVEYYRSIIAVYRERSGGAYPSIIINSIDLTKMLAFVAAGDHASLVEYLWSELRRLARAGADIGLMASNTPHIVYDEVTAVSPIPLVSIVEAACDFARKVNLRRVGLFGTRFTMQASFYQSVFSRAGIDVVTPDAAEQELIHARYMNELVNARFLQTTRDELLSIVSRLKAAAGVDGIILGGTELPLLLRDESWQGVRFLDTGRIHAERAVTEMLA